MDLRKFFIAFIVIIPLTVNADIINFTSIIDSAQANAGQGSGSPGSGSAVMQLDTNTREFSWNIAWQDLQAPPVSALHFHGPAAPDANAGVQLSVDRSNPSIGSTTLSNAQAQDLLNNLWYINVHTDPTQFPSDELRGQIFPDVVVHEPFVLQNDRWESLVIPANPQGFTVEALFGDDLNSGDYGTTWIIYTFNPDTQQYEQPEISGELQQGRAFWITQRSGLDVELDLPEEIQLGNANYATECAARAGCFSIPLPSDPVDNRFDLVGAPFGSPSLLGDIRLMTNAGIDLCTSGCDLDIANDEQFTSDTVFVYDASINNYRTPGTADSVNAWQGYWVVGRPMVNGKSPELLLPFNKPIAPAPQ